MNDVIQALRAYQQADAEGVMVLVSREACERAATLLEGAACGPGGEPVNAHVTPIAYANGDELDNMLHDREARVSASPTGWLRTALYSAGQVRGMIYNAVLAERHACSIAVWMTLQDALADDADDKGLEGWMREAEARVKARA